MARRGKIGDVYAVKVPNGFKLYQYAYPKNYIRVFGGLYNEIPPNIAEIVNGPHDYIIGFFSNRLYRIGLAQFLVNLPVPEEYPLPEIKMSVYPSLAHGKMTVRIQSVEYDPASYRSGVFTVSSLSELPEEYQNIKLVGCSVSASMLFYLFNYGFNHGKSMEEQAIWYPSYVLGDKHEEVFAQYEAQINEAWDKDRLKRQQTRKSRKESV